MDADVQARKRAAAEHALAYVRDGMVLGLGSGSTAELFVAALGARVRGEARGGARGGLRVVGVPTSERAAQLARDAGVPLATLEERPRVDLTVDGADEIDPRTFDLIKGRGGALVREKLVAVASGREIIVADDGKLVRALGERQPVPVAVVPFGWSGTAARLEELGCSVRLRRGADGTPSLTDDGHYILDCRFGPIGEPARLADRIKSVPGVVEHGLFIGRADLVVLGTGAGVKVLEPEEVRR
jgi:ribose 5-phosphate isomerase A